MSPSPKPNDEEKKPLKKRPPEPKPSPQSVKEIDLWDLDDEIPAAAPVLRVPRTTLPTEKKKNDLREVSSEPEVETPAESNEEIVAKEEPAPPLAEESISEPETTVVLETITASAEVPQTQPPVPMLSQVEKIGLISLLVLLLSVVLFFVWFSLSRLPSEQKLVGGDDFPITAQGFTITSAETFWRTPITVGANPDRVRIGTQLVPVLKMRVQGHQSALRIFFRDADGNIAGDGISRSITGTETVEISSSVGFFDRGMYAAYRAGEGKPWKAEVFVGPSESAASNQFKKIYETYISTSLH